MTIQLITHDKLLERRERLKEKGKECYLAFKDIRYALFRMQNFLGGGAAPESEHFELSKKYEEEVKPLGGFLAFADLWDLDPLTEKVIKRDKSVWKAHEEFMEKAAVPLQMQKEKPKKKRVRKKK